MQKISGLLFAISGFVILMGITTAAVFYPGYSDSHNFISNLGSSPPPDVVIRQPSAFIFDSSMIVAGLMVVAGGIMLDSKKQKMFKTSFVVTGIGLAGVGLYPAYHGVSHDLIAFTTFAAGGISAILAYRHVIFPFKYLSIVRGITSLTVLIIGVFATPLLVPTLGVGGVERWIAYPITIWIIAYGGYLMAGRSK